jgi:hypothetical protein
MAGVSPAIFILSFISPGVKALQQRIMIFINASHGFQCWQHI